MVDMFAYLITFDRDQPVGPISFFFFFFLFSPGRVSIEVERDEGGFLGIDRNLQSELGIWIGGLLSDAADLILCVCKLSVEST